MLRPLKTIVFSIRKGMVVTQRIVVTARLVLWPRTLLAQSAAKRRRAQTLIIPKYHLIDAISAHSILFADFVHDATCSWALPTWQIRFASRNLGAEAYDYNFAESMPVLTACWDRNAQSIDCKDKAAHHISHPHC
eukprot:6201845-Pleurochrysis_carterae.AAC.2